MLLGQVGLGLSNLHIDRHQQWLAFYARRTNRRLESLVGYSFMCSMDIHDDQALFVLRENIGAMQVCHRESERWHLGIVRDSRLANAAAEVRVGGNTFTNVGTQAQPRLMALLPKASCRSSTRKIVMR